MFLDNIDNIDNIDTVDDKAYNLATDGINCVFSYQILSDMLQPFENVLEAKYNVVKIWIFYSILLAGVGIFTGSPIALIVAVLPFCIPMGGARIYAGPKKTEDIALYQQHKRRHLDLAASVGIKIPQIGPDLYLSDIQGWLNTKRYSFMLSKHFRVLSWIVVILTTLLSITSSLKVLGFTTTVTSIAAIVELIGLLLIRYQLDHSKNAKLLKEIVNQQSEKLNEVVIRYGPLYEEIVRLGIPYFTDSGSCFRPFEQLMQNHWTSIKADQKGAPQ